jgi:polar amino acid transport system substrate-binding protein
MVSQDIVADLAPTGVLRAGINLSNVLLVTDKAANGDPVGVSPEMAAMIAERLGLPLELIPYDTPGEVADAIDNWDIGLIAADPKRAETIAFTTAYVQVEATYLVPEDSPFQDIDDVDADGVQIAIAGRAAYDLFLDRHLKHAELKRGKGLVGAVALFREEKLDALAGLRPALLDNQKEFPGSRVLDGCYTTVQQAIGTRPQSKLAAEFLQAFVDETTGNGTVQGFIDKHGVTGRLSVANKR